MTKRIRNTKLAPVTAIAAPAQKKRCGNCGAEMSAQKAHCPVHDTVYDIGTECPECERGEHTVSQ